MAYTNSDQVKQSIDSLEKYRLFTESKLKQFILKEFDQCIVPYFERSCWKEKYIIYSHSFH